MRGVVPNSRQISGRSPYTVQPDGPRCTRFSAFEAASCSASLFTGSRDISSEEVVTGPQQSWQPGTQSKKGMRWRKRATISQLQLTNIRLLCDHDANCGEDPGHSTLASRVTCLWMTVTASAHRAPSTAG